MEQKRFQREQKRFLNKICSKSNKICYKRSKKCSQKKIAPKQRQNVVSSKWQILFTAICGHVKPSMAFSNLLWSCMAFLRHWIAFNGLVSLFYGLMTKCRFDLAFTVYSRGPVIDLNSFGLVFMRTWHTCDGRARSVICRVCQSATAIPLHSSGGIFARSQAYEDICANRTNFSLGSIFSQ